MCCNIALLYDISYLFVNRTTTLDVHWKSTILDVKQMYAEKSDTLVDDFILVYCGNHLTQEYLTISDHEIQAESTLHVLLMRVKAITPQGHILTADWEQQLYDRYNIPIESQTGIDFNGDKINFKIPDTEIILFIHYVGNKRIHKQFAVINKDEPLYKIGEKLYFYHPTMMNDRDYLQLKYEFTDLELDIYKTPNDYKEILKPETVVYAEMDTSKPQNNNEIIFGYIRMVSNKLNIFVPVSIIQIIQMFYRLQSIYETLLFSARPKYGGGSTPKTMLDVYEGKKFKLNVKSINTTGYKSTRMSDFVSCTAKRMKLSKSLLSKVSISNFNHNTNCNGILHCTSSMSLEHCRLILYDSNQLKSDNQDDKGYVNIDAFEIKMPDLQKYAYENMSLIYDEKRNSFYNIHLDAFYKLDMNMDIDFNDMKWDKIDNIKLKYPRNGAALLCHDDSLFVIDGDRNETYKRKIEMINMKTNRVVKLPDIPRVIKRCTQSNCVYVSQKNQIAVGHKRINILDISKGKWIQHSEQIRYKARYKGTRSRNCLWNDINDCNIFYIATNAECIEWIDIREKTNKFHILWKLSLSQWFDRGLISFRGD